MEEAMTDYLWPAVALVVAVLAFAAVMRWLGNAPRADFNELVNRYHELKQAFDMHEAGMKNVLVEWRQKVRELDEKCDRVVINAKNEIAGDLATVSNITNKGWR
jgi:hypothetical protein